MLNCQYLSSAQVVAWYRDKYILKSMVTHLTDKSIYVM